MRTRLDVKRLGDLDDLPAAEGQSPDRRVRRFDQVELLADVLDCARQASVVDEPAPARVGAEADVLRNREMGRETQLLLHHGDAQPMRLARRQRCDRAAIDQDFSAVGPERTRQQVDERALARSILSEESVDAAGGEIDRDLAQHRVAEEGLRESSRS
jgi:hypothetical protein